MPTIFTKIISGEIPCFKVAEDADHLAFLDINPLRLGHTLVIPKKEMDYIFDMDDASLAGLMQFTKKVAKALKKVVPCTKVGVSVIGLEVAHTHIHLIPMDEVADMNFESPKLKFGDEEMSRVSTLLQAAFND